MRVVQLPFPFVYYNQRVGNLTITDKNEVFLGTSTGSYRTTTYFYHQTLPFYENSYLYRIERNATMLARLSARITSSIISDVPSNFSATNAFVVTWLQRAEQFGGRFAKYLANRHQFILVTDGTFSYFMLLFQQGDTISKGVPTMFFAPSGYASSYYYLSNRFGNSGLRGQYIFRVDGGGSEFFVFIIIFSMFSDSSFTSKSLTGFA